MARRADSGELFWGYSVGENGRVIVSLLDAPRYVGRDSLLEVELDNGEVVRATPDHEFMLRDGRMLRGGSPAAGQSLMPLYRDLWRGYEMVYQPLNGHLLPTHRLADEWNLRGGIYADRPERIAITSISIAATIDRPTSSGCRRRTTSGCTTARATARTSIPQAHGAAIRDALARLAGRSGVEPAVRRRASAASPRVLDRSAIRRGSRRRAAKPGAIRAEDPRTPPTGDVAAISRSRANVRDKAVLQCSGVGAGRRFAPPTGRLKWRVAIRFRPEIDAAATCALRWTRPGRYGALRRLLDCDRSVFRRFPDVVVAVRRSLPGCAITKWSPCANCAGDHDVYCLTVPEAGNFALEAGVFVRNCGIIVNVTPLEPEWEGHVTLEFSNTTPLPAKIYANEGVAQVIFFESDEVCETSYKDRGGKYQGQQGVTLPKI